MLPLTAEEELFLCGKVDVEPDIVLTVPFEEDRELDSGGAVLSVKTVLLLELVEEIPDIVVVV